MNPRAAAAGVLGHLADLGDIAELGRLAELALADRPGVGIGDRHEAIGDVQAAGASIDLVGDLLAAGRQLLELGGGPQLGLGATAPRRRPGPGSEPPRLAGRAGDDPACALSAITCALAFAGATRKRLGQLTHWPAERA